jgi:AraC family transcriptional regulator
MTTAADQFDDTLSPTDLQFSYLANSLAQLLETARREFERDREAAKASLVTASHTCERRSSAVRTLTAP